MAASRALSLYLPLTIRLRGYTIRPSLHARHQRATTQSTSLQCRLVLGSYIRAPAWAAGTWNKIVVIRVELRCAVRKGTYGADAHERLDIAELQAPEGRAATDAEADGPAGFPKVGRQGDLGVVCAAALHRLRLRPHVQLVCFANRAATVRIKDLG